MPSDVTLSIPSFLKASKIFSALLPNESAFLFARNKADTHTKEQLLLTEKPSQFFKLGNRVKVISINVLSKDGLSDFPRPCYVYQRRN